MADFGLLATGFKRKLLADLKGELEGDFRTAFGQSVDLSSTEPFGQLIGIMSEKLSTQWELMEDVYAAFYPDTAEGVPLDNVVSLLGLTRLEATRSAVRATFTGDEGTEIPQGIQLSVSGLSASKFETVESGTIGSGGTLELLCRAVSTGPIQALAGTLTVIDTPLFGLASATNSLDADLGRNRETDAELRIRRREFLQRPRTPTVDGIRAALVQLEDVSEALVVENSTEAVDSDGRPPKSFEAYVQGGDAQVIRETIWSSKAAGIATYGTVTGTVVDSQGFTQTVNFSRPVQKAVYVAVTITKNSDVREGPLYPFNGDALVLAQVLAYGNTRKIGSDIWINQIFSYINQVPGVKGIDIKIGFSPSPSGTSNLSIAPIEISVFESANVTVASV